MSYRKVIGVAALVVIGMCGAGTTTVRERSAGVVREISRSTLRASEPMSAPGTKLAPGRATHRSPAWRRTRRAAPTVDAGLSPCGREKCWNITANVSNLNDVANTKIAGGRTEGFFRGRTHGICKRLRTRKIRYAWSSCWTINSIPTAMPRVMTSLQYEMHLNERGQKVDSIQRMTATGKEPAPPHVAGTRVLPGTRDPLGMLQYLRSVDWTKTAEVRCPVYDGHKLYDVRAKLVGAGEAVTVPAGSYKTSKIEMRVFDNGEEMKDAHFTIYLANNVARTPVCWKRSCRLRRHEWSC